MIHYTPELGQAICEVIAQGNSFRHACRVLGIPESTVRGWRERDDAFDAQYARAHEAGCHAIADEIREIADGRLPDATGGDPDSQRDRLRVDARKWHLSKMLPKVYGDKTTTEITGKDGAPLIPAAAMTDEQLAAIAAKGAK